MQIFPERKKSRVNEICASYRGEWEELLPRLWREREAIISDHVRSAEPLIGCHCGTYMTQSRPICVGPLLRCWMAGELVPYINQQPATDWRLFRFGGSPLSGVCMMWSAFNIVTGEIVDYTDPVEQRHGLFPGNAVALIHTYGTFSHEK